MRYLIKLSSIDQFFFGGNITFGENKATQNYLVRSEKFPQQTTLLGMLRYQLLKTNSLLKIDRSYTKEELVKIKSLIGENSFEFDKDNNYGIINNISPLFLFDESYKQFLTVTPFNHRLKYAPIKEKVHFKDKKELPFFSNYIAKEGKPDSLIYQDGTLLNWDKVFVEVEKIGIKKSTEGETNDDAFYKQFSYKMNPDFCFAFTIDFEDDTLFKLLNNDTVFMGGEKSMFKMKIEQQNYTICKKFSCYEETEGEIILVSDTFVDEDILEVCDFAITETINFRHIKSSINDKNHPDKNSKGNTTYNLLKRGSVLYCNDKTKEIIVNKIKNKAQFVKIGYNIINVK